MPQAGVHGAARARPATVAMNGAVLLEAQARGATGEPRGAPVSASQGYRPDIDGLRAFAIVPVVFFHYRIAPFAGGFVGVDVFFVISGFLITSLIYREASKGRFSIVDFYERRIRRIFPALFTVLAFTAVASFAILLPDDLRTYGKSLGATALFASNFEFLREASYFDAAADLKPLLHTWSLAVEEQYYLLFPPLIMLLALRSRGLAFAVIAALTVAFLALAIWLVAVDRPLAFYLLPGRAWELFLGASLALAALPALQTGVADALGAIGLALIGWSVFRFTGVTPFPGLASIPPCGGAALLILAGSGGRSLTARLLSTPPLVFIGKISYALYLWHWPLFVFGGYYALTRPLGPLEKAGLIGVSFILATLSWRFVERPFRIRPSPIGRHALFVGGACAMAAAVALGALAVATRGAPERFSPAVRRLLAVTTEQKAGRPLTNSPPAVRPSNLTEVGHGAAPPSFLLWGDSLASVLSPAVEAAADDRGRTGYFAEHNACPPLAGVTPQDHPECGPFNDAAMRVALSPQVREVILVSRWALNAEGSGPGDARRVVLIDPAGAARSRPDNHALFEQALEGTVARLRAAGKAVILVHSTAEIGWPVPQTLAKAEILGVQPPAAPTKSQYLARQAFVFAVFDRIKARQGVTIVRPDLVLCPIVCLVETGGRPIYFDDHHLDRLGALQLVPLMRAAM